MPAGLRTCPKLRTKEKHENTRLFGRDESEITSVARCDFYPSDPNAQRIRWASGDRKTPNSFTIYWDTDSGNAVDFPALVKETDAR